MCLGLPTSVWPGSGVFDAGLYPRQRNAAGGAGASDMVSSSSADFRESVVPEVTCMVLAWAQRKAPLRS